MSEKGDTADKIMRAAAVEFGAKGLAGARVDNIAARAGVNKAMIYYHFRSKEDLYQKIIEYHIDRMRKFYAEDLAEGEDIEKVFLDIANFFPSMFEEREILVPIFLRELAMGGDRLRKTFGLLMADSPTVKLKKIISDAKKSGLFRDIDERQAIASFIGMNLWYLIALPLAKSILGVKNEEKFIEKRPQAVVDLFLNGIRAK